MKSEKMFESFPHEKKVLEEAHRVNEAVDEHLEEHPDGSVDTVGEVAHEIIKELPNKRFYTGNLEPSEQQWLENMQDGGIRPLTEGWVEISRWTKIPSERPQLVKQKVDGLNSAIRMQDHILEKYDTDKAQGEGEYADLESIEEVIERANQILLRWKEASQEEKDELSQEVTGVILQLERCRNEFKLRTKEQMEKVIGFKDSKDRINPTALAARTISALHAVGKRIDELQAITPSIAFRRELLVLEQRRSESSIRKAAAQVALVLHHSVFSSSGHKGPESSIRLDEVRYLEREVNKALHYLDTIFYAPYKQQADQARLSLMQRVKKHLGSKKVLIGNLEEVKEALSDARQVLLSDMSDLG